MDFSVKKLSFHIFLIFYSIFSYIFRDFHVFATFCKLFIQKIGSGGYLWDDILNLLAVDARSARSVLKEYLDSSKFAIGVFYHHVVLFTQNLSQIN